jgi:hypothetical protein
MNTLQQFSENLWTLYFPLRIAGLELGTRATIAKLPSGGLVIISPVEFSDQAAEAVDALGPVDTIISPNLFHHLFYNQACERWPDARRLVPPGLREKKLDLVDDTLELSPEGSIEDTLKWWFVEGAPSLNEHLFLLESDEVLIVTDMAFHFIDHPSWWFRLNMRLLDGYGRLGPSRLARMTFRDKAAIRASIDRVLQQPFDAIVMAHGQCIESGGHALCEEAFARVL